MCVCVCVYSAEVILDNLWCFFVGFFSGVPLPLNLLTLKWSYSLTRTKHTLTKYVSILTLSSYHVIYQYPLDLDTFVIDYAVT